VRVIEELEQCVPTEVVVEQCHTTDAERKLQRHRSGGEVHHRCVALLLRAPKPAQEVPPGTDLICAFNIIIYNKYIRMNAVT
jgi:hypothetical protein